MFMLRVFGLHFQKILLSISKNTNLGSFQLISCEKVQISNDSFIT